MKKHLANIVTTSRILGTLGLMFTRVFSGPFFLIYAWCGISDVLDGFLARKLKISSQLGSKLDSFSDLLLYGVMLAMVWPYILRDLPKAVIYLIYLVLFLRLLAYVYVGFRDRTLESRHSILNKITGLLMFFLPVAINAGYTLYHSLLTLATGYVSMADETIHLIKGGRQ